MPGKVRTAEMSWREVEEARDRGVAVLVPMGSTDEHGPHTPMGDYMVADAITERVAQRTGDVMIPVMPFSYSEYFRKYPGTITLQAETMRLVLKDTVYCLLDQGFQHVILFNGHSGNGPILQTLLREFRRERGVIIPVVASTNFGVKSELTKELYGDNRTGHGAEPMGSKQMYLNPGLVDLNRVEDFGTKQFFGLQPTGLNGVSFKGDSVMMALNMEDITPPSGSLADPRLASVDKGERQVEAVVAALTEFVQWFKTVDPRVEP
jgi:creatinine amidohydrolase